ncbi:MAG TPA: hypothetical protein VFJ58_01080 [Armatimonadota bacterium]|nr:hypothetical protein [Armatimonadota bacterium]
MKFSTQQTSVGLVMVGLVLMPRAGTAAGSQPSQAQQAAADAVIQKMAAHYSSLSSVKVIIVGSMTLTMHGNKSTTGLRETLAMQKPDLYASSMYLPSASGDMAPGILVGAVFTNGRATTSYMGSLNQYTSGPAKPLAQRAGPSGGTIDTASAPASTLLRSLFTDSPTGQATEELLGPTRLVGREEVNGTRVVMLEYSPSTDSEPKGTKVLLDVDDNRGRLVRATTAESQKADIRIDTTETIVPVSENTPLPVSLFTFHPPDNAKLVDKFHPNSQPAADDAAVKTAAQMVGKPAPDFSLKDLSGKTVDLNNLKGRTILMDFSASW